MASAPAERRWLGWAKRAHATAEEVLSGEPEGPSQGLAAAELFRAALHAALLSRSPHLEGATAGELWAASGELLAASGLTADALGQCAACFEQSGSLAGRGLDDVAATAARFRRLSLVCISALEEPERRRRLFASKRLGRVGLFVALAVVVVGVLALALQKKDLLAGKSSRTSSTHGKFDGSEMAFHTAQENAPWIEYDLGAPAELSSLTVENRADCCRDRAVPLVAQVSDDGKQWREVAQRADTFRLWEPTFPRTRARYLRLTVPRRTFLHLKRVQAHP